jgi:superfamily II DNA or RNA helicase
VVSFFLVFFHKSQTCSSCRGATTLQNATKLIFLTATPTCFGEDHNIFNAEPVFTMSRQAAVGGRYIRDMEFVEVPVGDLPELLVIEETPVAKPVQPQEDSEQMKTSKGRKQFENDHRAYMKRLRIYHDELNSREREIRLAGAQLEDHKTYLPIAKLVLAKLKSHNDARGVRNFHQAMVTVSSIPEAVYFAKVYNRVQDNGAAKAYYSSLHNKESVLTEFRKGEIQVIVVVGCLREGFDHNKVSVVGIARPSITPHDFEQFVGRAVRLTETNDPTRLAWVVSHERFAMRDMFTTLRDKPVITETGEQADEEENDAVEEDDEDQ